MKRIKLILNFGFHGGRVEVKDESFLKNFNMAAVESIEEVYEYTTEEFQNYQKFWESVTGEKR